MKTGVRGFSDIYCSVEQNYINFNVMPFPFPALHRECVLVLHPRLAGS